MEGIKGSPVLRATTGSLHVSAPATQEKTPAADAVLIDPRTRQREQDLHSLATTVPHHPMTEEEFARKAALVIAEQARVEEADRRGEEAPLVDAHEPGEASTDQEPEEQPHQPAQPQQNPSPFARPGDNRYSPNARYSPSFEQKRPGAPAHDQTAAAHNLEAAAQSDPGLLKDLIDELDDRDEDVETHAKAPPTPATTGEDAAAVEEQPDAPPEASAGGPPTRQTAGGAINLNLADLMAVVGFEIDVTPSGASVDSADEEPETPTAEGEKDNAETPAPRTTGPALWKARVGMAAQAGASSRGSNQVPTASARAASGSQNAAIGEAGGWTQLQGEGRGAMLDMVSNDTTTEVGGAARGVSVNLVDSALEATRVEPHPVQAVSLFANEAKAQTCYTCGHQFAHQIQMCSICQQETRAMLVESQTRFQRDGLVMQVLKDRVDLTMTAKNAVEADDPVVSMRRPMQFVQVRDMLAMGMGKNTGWAATRT